MKFTLVLVAIVSRLAIADSGMDSGGGRSIVCFDSDRSFETSRAQSNVITRDLFENILRIESIDFYYAKRPMGLEQSRAVLVDDSKFTSGIELYNYLRDRLKNNAPDIYQAILESQLTFENSEIIWEDQPFGQIFDENTAAVIVRGNCVVTTMALQFREHALDYLHIDRQLFYHPLHSKLSQASLLLHEFLYLTGRNRGHVTSRAVRKLVRLLLRHDSVIDYKRIEFAAKQLNFID